MKLESTTTPTKQLILIDVHGDNDPEFLEFEQIGPKIIIRLNKVISNYEISVLGYMIRQGLLTPNSYRYRTYTTDAPYVEGTLENIVRHPLEIIIIHSKPGNTMHSIVKDHNGESVTEGRPLPGLGPVEYM